uniref:MH2 domain-containing protein n=1 Tax=Ditylenchus dipsaci TaxID=166011 RepID=A0A915DDC5_9BILA
MDSLIHHFSETLRHELQTVSIAKGHQEDSEDILQIVEDEDPPQKICSDTQQPRKLAEFMQQFPLSITALVRLLNESNSNSSTPCSDRHGKVTPPPLKLDTFHYSSPIKDIEVEQRGPLCKNKRPHSDSANGSPAMKKRQLSGCVSSGMTSTELLAMVSHVNTTNPHFPAIIQDILGEMDQMQKDDKDNEVDWKVELLKPLKSVLSVCLEKGTKKAMNRLVEAIFENINSKKSIPLMDAFRDDTPIYSIGYNEFNEPVHKQSQFFNPLVYCGALSMNSEQKEHFELGTNKLSERLSPLQTQQIYDCRRNIAYGMAMEVTDEGEVYVRCLSTRPLYVESHYLDRESMRVSGDVSHVIYQQAAIKVYDLWQSFQLMCFWITQRKLLSKNNNSQSSLKKLTMHLNRLCKFRVSFGVDWGTKQRPSISDTPCWVEVNMSRANHLVERLLERPEIAYNFVFNNNQNGKQIPPEGLLSPEHTAAGHCLVQHWSRANFSVFRYFQEILLTT